jgi:ActR/RegA family two-component response regulator
MSGTSNVIIHEEIDELLRVMKQQTQLKPYVRAQSLYLLKSGEANSISHAARLLGYDRKTVQRWLAKYQQSGLEGLLTIAHGGGRQSYIPQ